MTYQEMQERLTKVETLIQAVQQPRYQNKVQNVQETLTQLNTIKENLENKMKIIAEAEGIITTDNEAQAEKLASKGHNVNLKTVKEAPEGMYYIKIPRDAASQNKAQVIFNDLHGIKYEINDDPDGIVMYFKKEDFNAGVIDDLEGDGVQIIDTNIPEMNEEKIEVDGDTEFTLKLNHLLDKHVSEVLDEMLEQEEEEDYDADQAQRDDEEDEERGYHQGLPLGEGDKHHDDGDLDLGHQDDEPHMLKKEVYDIAVYAAKLYKQLKKYDAMENEVDFPHWWQRKVTLAREYMSKAQHYLEFEEKEPMIDQLALEGKMKNEIGMFHDPIGYEKSKPETPVFTKKYVGKGAYHILKNGKKFMTLFGSEGEANAYVNKRNKELKGEGKYKSDAQRKAIYAAKAEKGELKEDSRFAILELQDVLEELYNLSSQVKSTMKQHFPTEFRQGDAYGAFDFGTSTNPYDTTFEKILENLDSGLTEEDIKEPTAKDIKKGAKEPITKQAKADQYKAAMRNFVNRMKKEGILDKDGRPLDIKKYKDKLEDFKKTLKEAQATGFGTGQGRSKTIAKGREKNQDIKDKLDEPEKELPRIKVINGVPNILKNGKYVPMKKKVNETKISKKKFKALLAEAYYEVLAEAEAPESVEVFARRYPDLEEALIKLHTDDYSDFVKEVRLITPKPTELAVVIKNNQEYTLKWLGKDWEIQVRGERHYLGNATEVQEALKDIAILAKEAPMGEPEDEQEETDGDAGFDDLGGGGGADTGAADTGGLDDLGGEDEAGEADLSDEEIDFEEPEA